MYLCFPLLFVSFAITLKEPCLLQGHKDSFVCCTLRVLIVLDLAFRSLLYLCVVGNRSLTSSCHAQISLHMWYSCLTSFAESTILAPAWGKNVLNCVGILAQYHLLLGVGASGVDSELHAMAPHVCIPASSTLSSLV